MYQEGKSGSQSQSSNCIGARGPVRLELGICVEKGKAEWCGGVSEARSMAKEIKSVQTMQCPACSQEPDSSPLP